MNTTRTRRFAIASLAAIGAAAAALTIGGVAQAATNPHDDKTPAVINHPTQTTDPTLHQDPATGSWYYSDTTAESQGQL